MMDLWAGIVIAAMLLVVAVILWRTNRRLREIRDAAEQWRDRMPEAPRTGIDEPPYGKNPGQ